MRLFLKMVATSSVVYLRAQQLLLTPIAAYNTQNTIWRHVRRHHHAGQWTGVDDKQKEKEAVGRELDRVSMQWGGLLPTLGLAACGSRLANGGRPPLTGTYQPHSSTST
jgi:hypothetical protein